ncbi:hypothetical protein STRIP9103_08467 [Streptomyces ipomoeae 91-03]|uniref:Uncharacterized protein n=1 Tax=Streptomyces ipomoeae 91-03 TaxID=698759 RepID=L1KUU8_9ACTN|nr:hypothetical protein STRIP9103_08467 [Streptomyces ipomoeae 91-03]
MEGLSIRNRLPGTVREVATGAAMLGDLTGRYATGSYSRLATDGRTVPRGVRTVRARPSTVTGSPRPRPAMWPAPAAPPTS